MSQLAKSARGQILDFELLAIKQQLASAPVPKAVKDRKQAIDTKGESLKKATPPDDGFLAMATQAAEASKQAVVEEPVTPEAKVEEKTEVKPASQLHRK